MSRFISLLQKLNFVGGSVNEPEEDPDSLPVYTISECKYYLAVPKDTHIVSERILIVPFPDLQQRHSISNYLNAFYLRKFMI